MIEIICINDTFSPEWEVYFLKHGIIKPKKGSFYTIRDIVHNSMGEKGFLLNEIINPETPRISPIFHGIHGVSEQNWAISRFVNIYGEPIRLSDVNIVKELV